MNLTLIMLVFKKDCLQILLVCLTFFLLCSLKISFNYSLFVVRGLLGMFYSLKLKDSQFSLCWLEYTRFFPLNLPHLLSSFSPGTAL